MKNKNISKNYTYVMLLFIIAALVSCVMFNISLYYGFLASIAFCTCIFIKDGFSLIELLNMMKKGILECKGIVALLLLIGATIPIWLSSGVVPTMMYYGFKYMQGMNFVFAAFILTSIISIFMGTAFGTISTIGIALLGLGKVFGIPNYILLGAIVSGAYIADKASPISALLNFTLVTTKSNYSDTIKTMLKTLVPSYFITSIIYFYIGSKFTKPSHSTSLDSFTLAISNGFYISPLLLLIPLLIVILSFIGIKVIKGLSIGLICGIIASLLLQKLSISKVLTVIFTGYKGATNSTELNKILICSGVNSMLGVALVIMGALAIYSIFQGTGVVNPVINTIIAKISSRAELIFKTGLISSILTIVTCDQTVGILLPGELLKDKYKELGLANSILARTISDTGIIIAPIIPWNVNSIFILAITNVAAVQYAPYAVFCYVTPIVTIIVAYIYKITDRKLNKSKNNCLNVN
jgi:Na+:H+ antiporter, NhaC family